MAETSLKAQGWAIFDRIVAAASRRDQNPWVRTQHGLEFRPDYATLSRLLGVPVLLNATSNRGFPHSLSMFGPRTNFGGLGSIPIASGPELRRQGSCLQT